VSGGSSGGEGSSKRLAKATGDTIVAVDLPEYKIAPDVEVAPPGNLDV
jgi:hypothetical protein